jgi:hypothetical protein
VDHVTGEPISNGLRLDAAQCTELTIGRDRRQRHRRIGLLSTVAATHQDTTVV